MKLIQNLQRLASLLRKEPTPQTRLTPDVLRKLADDIEAHDAAEAAKGDGRAVFLSDMTDEEHAVHILEQDHGWKSFRDKVLQRVPEPDGPDGGELDFV